MKTSKNLHAKTLNITFIALFAALCYLAISMFRIPLGPMFIHFGNLLAVTAALLLGGWQGGLSGSIGMGLFDILGGYADSFPKTFTLKFLIGFITGTVFKALTKKNKMNKTVAAIISAICGMSFNLIGETLWKTVTYSLAGSTVKAAFVSAVLAQSSTLINAVISIIGGVLLYTVLEKPFSKILNK